MLYLLIAIAIIYVLSILIEIRLLTKYFWKCSVASLFKGMDSMTSSFLFIPVLNTMVTIVGISELIKHGDPSQ